MEFEPSATALEQEGAGYVIASLGVDSGYVPYTGVFREGKLSYGASGGDPGVHQRAGRKAWIMWPPHTPEEIAEAIQPQFERKRSGNDHHHRQPLSGTGYLEDRI